MRCATDENLTLLLADLLEELKASRLVNEALRHAIEQVGVGPQVRRIVASRLGRADLELLARLLPAIGGAVGSEWFLARDLVDGDNAALRLVLNGITSKQLGKLLRRAAGQPINGYVTQRGSVQLGCLLWRVVLEVSQTQKPFTAARDLL